MIQVSYEITKDGDIIFHDNARDILVKADEFFNMKYINWRSGLYEHWHFDYKIIDEAFKKAFKKQGLSIHFFKVWVALSNLVSLIQGRAHCAADCQESFSFYAKKQKDFEKVSDDARFAIYEEGKKDAYVSMISEIFKVSTIVKNLAQAERDFNKTI